MSDPKKLSDERETCRKILAEINNFGVSEHQRLFLIYLLSLELEDLQARFDTSTVVRTRMQELGLIVSSDE